MPLSTKHCSSSNAHFSSFSGLHMILCNLYSLTCCSDNRTEMYKDLMYSFCSFFIDLLKSLYVYVCACISICHMYRGPWRPQDSVRSPEARVLGGYKPPSVGAGIWTQVLEKQETLLVAKPSLQSQDWLFLVGEDEWTWWKWRIPRGGKVWVCVGRADFQDFP